MKNVKQSLSPNMCILIFLAVHTYIFMYDYRLKYFTPSFATGPNRTS